MRDIIIDTLKVKTLMQKLAPVSHCGMVADDETVYFWTWPFMKKMEFRIIKDHNHDN